jgi:hypothetical protein
MLWAVSAQHRKKFFLFYFLLLFSYFIFLISFPYFLLLFLPYSNDQSTPSLTSARVFHLLFPRLFVILSERSFVGYGRFFYHMWFFLLVMTHKFFSPSPIDAQSSIKLRFYNTSDPINDLFDDNLRKGDRLCEIAQTDLPYAVSLVKLYISFQTLMLETKCLPSKGQINYTQLNYRLGIPT